ncbi:competence protein ComK [Rossellomorea sp. NS-SX7]|uniref:competence protein ComK n=1 Tax=Rossellomorea sp. NS-SX7 TaxID=3463856 RepID=UPI004058C0E6
MRERENPITMDTMAIYPAYHERYQSVILNQSGNHIFSKRPVMDLLDDVCMRNGASYDGRVKAVKHVLPYFRKTPVIISEDPYILAFPTMSPQHYECTWLFCYHIEKFSLINGKTYVNFKNGSLLEVSCSVKVLQTQLERASATLTYFASGLDQPPAAGNLEESMEAPSVYSSMLPLEPGDQPPFQM